MRYTLIAKALGLVAPPSPPAIADEVIG